MQESPYSLEGIFKYFLFTLFLIYFPLQQLIIIPFSVDSKKTTQDETKQQQQQQKSKLIIASYYK